MMSFIIYGKSGQGVHTLAKLIGRSLFLSGLSVKDFAFLEQEKYGKPVVGYVASDKDDILSNDILGHDYIIIMDPTLNLAEIIKNSDKNTIIITNSKENIPALKKAPGKKHYIDATKIAMENLKRNQPNTALLGAVIKLCNKITIKNAKKAIELEIDDKVKENMESLEIGIKSVK